MMFLAIIATLASVAVTAFVVFANGMSSSPASPFKGDGIVAVVWIITAALWIAFAFS